MSVLPVFRLRPASKPSAPIITPPFESCLNTFKLDVPARLDGPADRPIVAAPPVKTIDPATSERNRSITCDRKRRRPTHEWNSLEEFQSWRTKEELDHGIELLLVRTFSAGGSVWHEKRIYVCSRQGTGGKSKYIRKRPERTRSRPTKPTGCKCRIVVKTYHHVSTVLGWYRAGHDHATGIANLKFTRLQDPTRAYAPSLLRRSVKPKDVTIKLEEARPISSDRPSYEHSEGSRTKYEELMVPYGDVSEAEPSQVDEESEVSDERSNGCADPGTPISSTFCSASPGPQLHTPGTTASAESPTLSVVPASQMTHDMAPPVLQLPSVPVPYYMPIPPLVIYTPYPPYQMTLYPVYFPPQTS